MVFRNRVWREQCGDFPAALSHDIAPIDICGCGNTFSFVFCQVRQEQRIVLVDIATVVPLTFEATRWTQQIEQILLLDMVIKKMLHKSGILHSSQAVFPSTRIRHRLVARIECRFRKERMVLEIAIHHLVEVIKLHEEVKVGRQLFGVWVEVFCGLVHSGTGHFGMEACLVGVMLFGNHQPHGFLGVWWLGVFRL